MAGNLGNRRDVAEIREISEILKFRTGYGLVSYPSGVPLASVEPENV